MKSFKLQLNQNYLITFYDIDNKYQFSESRIFKNIKELNKTLNFLKDLNVKIRKMHKTYSK